MGRRLRANSHQKNNENELTEHSEKRISNVLAENISTLKALYSDCYDVVFRSFLIGEMLQAELVFIDNMVDREQLDTQVLDVLMTCKDSTLVNIQNIINESLPVASVEPIETIKQCVDDISLGNPILFINGSQEAIRIGLNKLQNSQITDPENEPVIQGPKYGFNESLQTNASLLRQRIRAPELKMVLLETGRYTKTQVVVTYMASVADHALVEEVMDRLKRIEMDGVLESGYIAEMIEDSPLSPFPQIKSTERVDVVAANLLEGRLAIIVDGTPTVMIAPVSLISFIQAADDYYNRWLFGSSFRFLRISSLFLSLVLPALYVALTTLHQEMIPSDLLVSIASSHELIPFPTLVEAVIMQLIFEILREAGLRLPRQVGSAVTIVGALVVGEAAVTAGFVSTTMVIVTAISGITSFTAPAYSLEMAIRILRFVLILLGGFLGLLGVVFGLIGIAIHLSSLRSLGVPYLTPIAPANLSEWKDAWIRSPWWKLNRRPRLTGRWNKYRQAKHQKPANKKRGE
ncbi:spore germination protein [Pullulanibacillus camelliae]|uniref:Spore germination protein n=1 Tax=Pullulanibacillus camelliae TaxID=1707096 RepID=A0A8J2YLW7_9BACL|nr:spore germination protein [Pullulanibacillus camelliae]GGE52723.1 spore germination protein [Pullulanibacillus camelliae]